MREDKNKFKMTLSRLLFYGIGLLLIPLLYVGCSEDDPGTQDQEEEEQPDNRAIKEKASFKIGAAVKSSHLSIEEFANTLEGNFNRISAEFEMKMTPIWGSETSYNWEKFDFLVDYATSHDMEIHGHVLLWYREYPTWFKNAQYDSAEFETLIKEYITTVVSRHKGKIASWDVANEIFNDNGTLRVDEFAYVTFDDPIAFYGRCFQYARDADPDAKLFYNDYNVVIASGKRFAISEMVKRFENEGYPIDGIGGQFHYDVNTPETTIENGLRDMANTGLLFHISELDLKVNVNRSNAYQFTAGEQQRQGDKYQAIVEIYERVLPDEQKFGITTWGVTDQYTWLTDFWHEKEYPLLFDASYNKKKAYDGFLAGLNDSED